MSTTDPSTTPKYLRRVAFLDGAAPSESGLPVHVGQRVMLDGDLIPREVIDLTEGWSVSSPGLDGTVVSFSVNAEHVKPAVLTPEGQPGGKPEDGASVWIDGPWIDGRLVLTPAGQPWEEYQPHPRSSLDWYGRVKPRMVRVYFFAAGVEIRTGQWGPPSPSAPRHWEPEPVQVRSGEPT
jgi:hypothetical protein